LEDVEQLLLAFFIKIHDPWTRDLLSPAQWAVLAALFEFVHLRTDAGYVQVSAVADLANQVLGRAGERFKLNPRKASDVLASLGFSYRERSSQGSRLCLDQEIVAKIHMLKRNHGVQWLAPAELQSQMDACDFCKGNPSPTSTQLKG
jgi:hypothetical protein